MYHSLDTSINWTFINKCTLYYFWPIFLCAGKLPELVHWWKKHYLYKENFQGAQVPTNTTLLLTWTCFLSAVPVFLLGFFLFWGLISGCLGSSEEGQCFQKCRYQSGAGHTVCSKWESCLQLRISPLKWANKFILDGLLQWLKKYFLFRIKVGRPTWSLFTSLIFW